MPLLCAFCHFWFIFSIPSSLPGTILLFFLPFRVLSFILYHSLPVSSQRLHSFRLSCLHQLVTFLQLLSPVFSSPPPFASYVICRVHRGNGLFLTPSFMRLTTVLYLGKACSGAWKWLAVTLTSVCVCVCLCVGLRLTNPIQFSKQVRLRAGFLQTNRVRLWDSLCVLVIWVSSLYDGTTAWECTDAVSACSDTCALHAMTCLTQLLIYVCHVLLLAARSTCEWRPFLSDLMGT